MPQLDFESLVSALSGASTDQKVACEPTEQDADDSPPESFWLSNDAEHDWWDRNAVYERNESTKGSSISTNLNPNSASNSQRFSKNLKKSKATIIGLPKSQKASFAEARCRRNHRPGNNTRSLFPKRSASIGAKSDSSVFEPSSPKVSCIGRVRSKRGHNHNRRLRTRQRSISSTTTSGSVVRQKSLRNQRKKKTGFIESVCAIFRSHRREKSGQKSDLAPAGDSSLTKKKSRGRKAREGDGSTVSRTEVSFEEPVYSGPLGLGSMNRFASGRRPESWRVGETEINHHSH
ncbi:serine/arginine-rich splicing factor 4-like protein [Trifolium pratense]|uniref:Serine/arginine-rich splicing factor 4-like protein n=1 Tax=Trifolium pratense TaxID=57577 RepID=A0A2K3PMY7_TRIPR|nr:serine/arginine-rich splicing factor 4-like protein [Trifolium pratense]